MTKFKECKCGKIIFPTSITQQRCDSCYSKALKKHNEHEELIQRFRDIVDSHSANLNPKKRTRKLEYLMK